MRKTVVIAGAASGIGAGCVRDVFRSRGLVCRRVGQGRGQLAGRGLVRSRRDRSRETR